MASELPTGRRSVALAVAACGLVALAVWLGVGIVERSGDVRFYYEYRHERVLPAYPTVDVLEALGLIALELAVGCALLIFPKRTAPALRLLTVFVACAGVFACELPFAFAFVMHAPPYAMGHFVYLILAGPWALVMAVVAALESRARKPHLLRDRGELPRARICS